MRIDLHAHTQNCKVGDGDKRNISPEQFVNKMKSNGVGICSITNHNKFDNDEYKKVIGAAGDLVVFPGIELDVMFEGEERQIIVVANPELADKFYSVFDDEPERDLDNHVLEYDDFLEKVNEFTNDEIVIIAHFMNKAKGFKVEERSTLYSDLSDYSLVLETSNLRSMGFVNGHMEKICLIGSDVKDWDKYSGDELPEIKFGIDSFGKFYELASDPVNFVKNCLDGAPKHAVSVDDDGSLIDIFEDVNVIFGEKGSGKTVLLKDRIHPGLKRIGKNTVLHLGERYEEYYENIIKDHSTAIEIDSELQSEILTEFDSIVDYQEEPHDNFIKDYLAYKKDDNKNKQAKTINKRNASFSSGIGETIERRIRQAQSNITSISEVSDINRKIDRSQELRREALETELVVLKEDVQSNVTSFFRNYFVNNGTESLLRAIKETVRKESGVISKPTNIGFSKLVSKRLERTRSNLYLTKSLEAIGHKTSVLIGELPKKGKVRLEIEIQVMPQGFIWSSDSVFDKNTVRENREILSRIHQFSPNNFPNINDHFNSEHISGELTGEDFVDQVVRKSTKIKIKNNGSYHPSPGEKAILSITGTLESYDYSCYLFDEIEKGLGHKYIAEYLIPQIKKLRDRGKTIILTTHDANIAVSTLPSQTIYCSYPDEEIYYEGNMYSNELIGIKSGSKLNWLDEAIVHLEGGNKMFSKRRNIYGA
ncbi:MAG TPA: hypothetical protein PKB09_02505 [Candidatus Saccharibacteria bacterium]|nr:hypothetical protein [Candidatus Saccharibacteria bacterium]